MTKLAGPLLLVGCGKMGSALLCGWIEHGLSGDDIVVVEPARSATETVSGRFDVHVVGHIADVEPNRRFRAVVFAVKPQVMESVLPAYAERIDAETVVISIAAGCSVGRFEQAFGDGIAVVRAMPNTPAAIGQGVTALFANARVDQDQHALAEALMTAVGAVHWVNEEALMHAITAMSGGGPAYVFLLIEALAQAGMASGLPEDLAWPMARATVIGSSALAEASDEPAATLRRNVTSPGGTTQAALEVLMAPDGVQPLFDQAMAAATRRSQELS